MTAYPEPGTWFHLHNSPMRKIISSVPIEQIRKLKHRDMKWLTRGHTAHRWKCWFAPPELQAELPSSWTALDQSSEAWFSAELWDRRPTSELQLCHLQNVWLWATHSTSANLFSHPQHEESGISTLGQRWINKAWEALSTALAHSNCSIILFWWIKPRHRPISNCDMCLRAKNSRNWGKRESRLEPRSQFLARPIGTKN